MSCDLWETDDGWEGYRMEDGAYYYVNTTRDEADWLLKIRVGPQAVRDAIEGHIQDPDAGGIGRFERGCSP